MTNLYEQCLCCNSSNLSNSEKKSFFNLPVIKCNNCLTHFVQFNDTINFEDFYREEYWENFRKNNKNVLKNKENSIKKQPGVLQIIFRIFLNLGKIIGVDQSRSLSQFIFFKDHLDGTNLFEIGSGEGAALKFFEQNGFTVSGLEPSKKKFKHN